MKKTTVCEVCKKRYKMPLVLNWELREHICLTCEVRVGMLISLYKAYPALEEIDWLQLAGYARLMNK